MGVGLDNFDSYRAHGDHFDLRLYRVVHRAQTAAPHYHGALPDYGRDAGDRDGQ